MVSSNQQQMQGEIIWKSLKNVFIFIVKIMLMLGLSSSTQFQKQQKLNFISTTIKYNTTR